MSVLEQKGRIVGNFGQKRWSVSTLHAGSREFGVEYLAEVYQRVVDGRTVGGAGSELEMRCEDRALQLLRKAGFIKYAGRKLGWKTTEAIAAREGE